MEPLDCAQVAAWVDSDPSIRAGLRLDDDMDAIAVEIALISTIGRPNVFWAVVEREGEIVGAVGASHLSPDGTAVVHQVVSPDHRFGKTAFKAAKAGIEYAREHLGVKNFVAHVPRWLDEEKTVPHPALRLNKALGFVSQDVEVLLLEQVAE